MFTQLIESKAFESGLFVYPIKRGFTRNELGKSASVHVGSQVVVYHCGYMFSFITQEKRKPSSIIPDIPCP